MLGSITYKATRVAIKGSVRYLSSKNTAIKDIDLGRINWSSAAKLQEAIVDFRVKHRNSLDASKYLNLNDFEGTGNIPTGDATGGLDADQDVLLFCEHAPVYTTGRRVAHNEEEQNRLENLGAQYLHCKRGGQITFHGPGQVVGYPIVDLKLLHKGARWFVQTIETVLIRTCRDFGLEAHGSCEHTGVWIGDRKIAAIGIQVSRGMTWHGFAMNCNTDLAWFNHIVPCGIPDRGVTSVSNELAKDAVFSLYILSRALHEHFRQQPHKMHAIVAVCIGDVQPRISKHFHQLLSDARE